MNWPFIFQEIEEVRKVVGPFQQQPDEDETTYYKRIFQKRTQESDTDFEKRVTIIKKQVPSLTVWKDDVYKKYITIVKQPKETTTTTIRTVSYSQLPVTIKVSIVQFIRYTC